MRERTILIRKRQSFRSYLNYFFYLLFRYHHMVFGRLIVAGGKIKAFNKFIELKKILKQKEQIDPLLVFLVSMINITPIIFSRPIKLGAQVHGVPTPINAVKQVSVAVKLAIQSSRMKKGIVSITNLANNLILSIYNKGPIIEKKLSLYKTAGLNRHLIRFLFR